MFEKPIGDKVRLFIREPQHAEECFALIDTNREHLRQWLSWVDNVKNPDDARKNIDDSRRQYDEGKSVVAGISYEDRIAGIIGLKDIDTRNGSAEIGYWIGKQFEGKGLITLACRALLDYAFSELGLQRVQIQVDPANIRSRAIPRRLGFHYEGTLRSVRRVNDEYRDLEVYSILRDEWAE